ncbi:glycoside hydrolase family 16 protein [Aspergillus stella-maris]|uniref:glycoside hydrolase family 16 protein n=1 Tax=Aspergillus stella-maris TaxID=1810926 RepID=UPI003CCE387D
MYLKYAAALASVLPLALAQTYTDCNPLEKSCKPDPGLNSKSFDSDFTQGDSALDGWIKAAGDVSFGPDGAELTINKQGDAPTIETDFYFFFGKAEVVMKTAPGTGIVSSVVIESDVLDEVDWEALGGVPTQIQTNYFGKGDTSSYDRVTYEPVDGPQNSFHTYTIEWTPQTVSWAINGDVRRTLTRAEAQGGSRFPQTPARLRIGIWAGGDPTNGEGTIEWAGGETDYSAAPFTMYIKSVHIENTYPGNEYSYSDNSGDWQSINVDNSKPDTSASSSSSTSSDSTTTTKSTASSSSSSTSTDSETTTSTTDSETSSPTSTTTDSDSETSTSDSDSSSPTATETGAGSGSGSGSGPSSDSSSDATSTSGSGSGSDSESGSSSSTPTESEGATPTDSTDDPEFTGAASSLTKSVGGLFTVVGVMAAMLHL